MQKTKLGVSVGFLGAALFFCCYFGSYIVPVLLAGYILLFEENAWLKKTAVRGLSLMIGFSLLYAVIGLIPNVITFVNSICYVFGGSFHISVITNIISVVNRGLEIVEKVLFILLGLKAFHQGTIKIPVIDPIVDKYMG